MKEYRIIVVATGATHLIEQALNSLAEQGYAVCATMQTKGGAPLIIMERGGCGLEGDDGG